MAEATAPTAVGQTLTADTALNILNRMTVCDRPEEYKGVVISSIRHADRNGVPFMWKASDGRPATPYSIINLRAMTAHHEEKAAELFEQGLYTEATNQTMSFSMDTKEAAKFVKNQTVTVRVVEGFSDKLQIPVLWVDAITPTVAIVGRESRFAALKREKAQALADIKAKALEAEQAKANETA